MPHWWWLKWTDCVRMQSSKAAQKKAVATSFSSAMADLDFYHLNLFPFQLWIPPAYTAGLWRPVASRGQRERTSCTSCPCFCLTTPTSSVEKGNGIAPERSRRSPRCFSYLSPPLLLFPTPPQWPRSLQHGSQPVSRPHGGRRQLLHDLPHHLERVPGLHLRHEDGPGTGWEHHSKLEPQSVCLQVGLAVVCVHALPDAQRHH